MISWRGGCRWRETVPIFTQHVETYDFCATEFDADDFASSTSLTYFLVPGVQRFACAPVGPPPPDRPGPGAHLGWRCVEGTSVSANTTVYVGPETVQTGAGGRHPPRPPGHRPVRPVPGRRRARPLARPDGLVVKEEREVALRVRSGFVGLLTYEERASFLLTAGPGDLR